MSVIIFIFVLLILILVHEFGHFIVAKAFKIRVDEFGFGFPPRAKKLFKRGETEYTLNWIPFGGFVKIYGQDPSDIADKSDPDYKRSFANKSKIAQACVLLAGVVFNFVFAGLLLSIGFMSGQPTSYSDASIAQYIHEPSFKIVVVEPNSPAEIAGIKTGDELVQISTLGQIVKFDNEKTQNIEVVKKFILENKSNEINFEIKRNGLVQDLKIKPKLFDAGYYGVGISADRVGIAKLPFFKAIYYGFDEAVYFTKETFAGFGKMIGEAVQGKTDTLKQVTGPVGIVSYVGDAYHMGFVYLLIFTALISINLAVINLLPFPALDGGRLLFIIIETITFRKISNRFFNVANMIGFFLLIALMVIVTFKDIAHLVG